MTAPHITVSGTKTFYPIALLLRGTESKGRLPFSRFTNTLLSQASVNIFWASETERRRGLKPFTIVLKGQDKMLFYILLTTI